jgi:hypothetical protein
MQYIKSNFIGQKPLWKVFWLDSILLGFAAVALVAIVMNVAVTITSFSSTWVAPFIMVAWLIWVACGLWTCAFNCKWSGWGYISRGYVVLLAGSVVLAAGKILLLTYS